MRVKARCVTLVLGSVPCVYSKGQSGGDWAWKWLYLAHGARAVRVRVQIGRGRGNFRPG